MENTEVLEIIANLKGRRKYEEKKAKKLGFDCLYKYFEDKIEKKTKLIADKESMALSLKSQKTLSKEDKSSKKSSCGCC